MTDHATIRGLLASYAMGALDEDRERADVERHLDECAECRAELREHRETLVQLAEGLPEAAPRPEVRARMLARAREVRAPSVGTADPVEASSAQPERPSRPPASRPASSGGAAGWLAAAAMALLAMLVGWGYVQADRAHREAAARADGLVAELEAERIRAAVAEDLVETLLAEDVATVSLSGEPEAPSMRLFWNRDRNTVVVTAFDLSEPPAGRTYQLWGIDAAAGTAPVSLGTFEPDDAGRTIATLEIPAGVSFDTAAVTEEPDGGSPAPTTTPFLVGSVNAGN